MTTWFTADTHFGHANVIRYCERPFASVQEMDDVLIENWNYIIKPKDTVYHLGDFTLAGKEKANDYFSRLNGKILNNSRWTRQKMEFGRVSIGQNPVTPSMSCRHFIRSSYQYPITNSPNWLSCVIIQCGFGIGRIMEAGICTVIHMETYPL